MEEYRRVGATLYEYLTPRVKQWNGNVKDTRRPLCLVAARERDKSFSWRLQRNAPQLGKLYYSLAGTLLLAGHCTAQPG